MVSAIWNDATIATSNETVVVEGNHYFPPSAVDFGLLEMSPHTSVCPIKGTARYFHVRVGDALNVNAAWTYPDPTPGAEGIRIISPSGKAWRLRSRRTGGGLSAMCKRPRDGFSAHPRPRRLQGSAPDLLRGLAPRASDPWASVESRRLD